MRKMIFVAHYRPLACLSAMVRAALVLTVFCLAATMLHTLPALAADTTVSFPWGDWLVDGLVTAAPVIKTIIGGLVMLVLGFLPGPLRAIASVWWQRHADQVLGWAIAYAIAQTKGAVAGKVLTVDLTNEVLAAAARYARDQAPVLVKRATGGDIEKLFDMLLARLEVRGMVEEGFGGDKFVLPDWVEKLA